MHGFNLLIWYFDPMFSSRGALLGMKLQPNKFWAAILATSVIVSFSNYTGLAFGQDYGGLQDYSYYSQQGEQLFSKGQLTQAIEMFRKALPLAEDISIPVVYNNLAATYIKRGNYFINQKDLEKGLSDFRMAYFYLHYGWPEGVAKKPLHESNLKVAQENVTIGYRNLRINPADPKVHMELAKKLRLQGKFQEAIVEYARVHELNKNNAEALRALGDLFNVLNDPYKSKKYYQALSKLQGGEVADEVLVQLGNAFYKTGEVDPAVVHFNKALLVNPGNTAALNQLEKIWLDEIKFHPSSVLGHANLAGVYQKKKMYDKAFQQYNAAEHFANQDSSTPFEVKKMIRLNIGTLFQEKRQYDMALKAYDTVLQTDPNNALAHYYKATLFRDTGNTDGAIQAYNRVLSLDPNHALAQQDLLEIVKQHPDPSRVGAELRSYADRFPGNALIQSKVGEEFHRLKDYDSAALYYQRAIQQNPNMAAAYANLGAVYQAQGKDVESLQAFKKAQELNPDNEKVKELAQSAQEGLGYKYYQAAVQLHQEGKTQEAIEQYLKALEILPDNAEIHANLAISYQANSTLDKAIHHYQKAMALDSKSAEYHYYLGTAFHQQNQLGKALQEYKKAVELDPDLSDATEAIALIEQQETSEVFQKAVDAFNQKNYPTALTLLDQTLQKDPDNATAHYYKGLVYNAQNKSAAAAQSYRKAIQYKPDFADAYYALGVILDGQNDAAGAKNAYQKFVELMQSEDDFVKYAKDRLQSLSSR